MPHCTIHSGVDVHNNLEWVVNLSGPQLLNINLLVRRDMSCVLSNRRMVAHHRMRYTVESFDVPLHNFLALVYRPLYASSRTWTIKS
jgi:hypothetical protein